MLFLFIDVVVRIFLTFFKQLLLPLRKFLLQKLDSFLYGLVLGGVCGRDHMVP